MKKHKEQLSNYAKQLEFMKSLENKVFTLKEHPDNKFMIGNGIDDDFIILVLDSIGWVASIIKFMDILYGHYTVESIKSKGV